MQAYSRILAVDDGYFPPCFKGGRGFTVLAGILFVDGKPRDARLRLVVVDGRDATTRIIEICRSLSPHLLLLDGITYAGFNYADPERILVECRVNLLIVYSHKPDPEAHRAALVKHFEDWEERWRVIGRHLAGIRKLDTPRGPLYVNPLGLSEKEAKSIIATLQVHSRIPEPLRIAHLVASASSRAILHAAYGPK